jgi:hypothetical protein
MTRSSKLLSASACLGAFAIAAASGLAIPQARAQDIVVPIPNGPTDFCCITDPNLRLINANIHGNVGIARRGGFIGFGSGTITGQVRFAAPFTATSCVDPDGVDVIGGITFGNANVDADFDALIMASESLSQLKGTPLVITGIPPQNSVDVSSGKKQGHDFVFTATIGKRSTETGFVSTFTSGTRFTIYGTRDQFVVFNIASTEGLGFDGSIVLAGGITSDHVLFNFHKGDFHTLTGGDTVMIDTDGNPTTGIFLNPNANFIITDSMIFGRIFGGGSESNSIIQTMNPTNADFRTNIIAPPASITPVN